MVAGWRASNISTRAASSLSPSISRISGANSGLAMRRHPLGTSLQARSASDGTVPSLALLACVLFQTPLDNAIRADVQHQVVNQTGAPEPHRQCQQYLAFQPLRRLQGAGIDDGGVIELRQRSGADALGHQL